MLLFIHMGYKGEKASLNQYQLMFDYIKQSGALDQLKGIFSTTANFKLKVSNSELSNVEGIKVEKTGNPPLPVIAFDAGMAKFFKDSPCETVVIKTAGAGDKELEEKYRSCLSAGFIHVFTGKIKNPRVFKEEYEKLELSKKASENWFAGQELYRLLTDSILNDFDVFLNEHFEGNFKEEVIDWILRSKKIPELDNLAREFVEWSYILQSSKKIRRQALLVKDGSLITNQFGSGLALAKRLDSFFKGEVQNLQPYLVGVVKESRFIKDEGHLVSRVISNYAKIIPKNGFFKIPYELESLLDSTPEDQRAVQRIFLSLNQGKKVYEIQIPMILFNNKKDFNQICETLLSQVTSLYGGSIAANSLAHKAASLSEGEAYSLEKQLKEIIEKANGSVK